MSYTLIDGNSGGSTANPDRQIKITSVWFSGTAVAVGKGLELDTAATLPTGIDKAYKTSVTDDSRTGGLFVAEALVGGPSTGSYVQVYTQGHLTGPIHGIIDSGSGISLGDQVGVANGGGIKTAAAVANTKRIIGVCVKAFTASTADGEILLYPQAVQP